jgi:hypothetical protein
MRNGCFPPPIVYTHKSCSAKSSTVSDKFFICVLLLCYGPTFLHVRLFCSFAFGYRLRKVALCSRPAAADRSRSARVYTCGLAANADVQCVLCTRAYPTSRGIVNEGTVGYIILVGCVNT